MCAIMHTLIRLVHVCIMYISPLTDDLSDPWQTLKHFNNKTLNYEHRYYAIWRPETGVTMLYLDLFAVVEIELLNEIKLILN